MKKFSIAGGIVVCMITAIVLINAKVKDNNSRTDYIYYCDENLVISEINEDEIYDSSKIMNIQPCFAYELSLDNYAEHSDCVVEGVIKEIVYYSDDGIPWTKLTVDVSNCIYGDLQGEKEIELFDMGGYLPVDDFEKNYCEISEETCQYVYMDFFQKEQYNIGDRGIFFMYENNRFGCEGYDLTAASNGALIYNSKYKKYECQGEYNNLSLVEAKTVTETVNKIKLIDD